MEMFQHLPLLLELELCASLVSCGKDSIWEESKVQKLRLRGIYGARGRGFFLFDPVRFFSKSLSHLETFEGDERNYSMGSILNVLNRAKNIKYLSLTFSDSDVPGDTGRLPASLPPEPALKLPLLEELRLDHAAGFCLCWLEPCKALSSLSVRSNSDLNQWFTTVQPGNSWRLTSLPRLKAVHVIAAFREITFRLQRGSANELTAMVDMFKIREALMTLTTCAKIANTVEVANVWLIEDVAKTLLSKVLRHELFLEAQPMVNPSFTFERLRHIELYSIKPPDLADLLNYCPALGAYRLASRAFTFEFVLSKFVLTMLLRTEELAVAQVVSRGERSASMPEHTAYALKKVQFGEIIGTGLIGNVKHFILRSLLTSFKHLVTPEEEIIIWELEALAPSADTLCSLDLEGYDDHLVRIRGSPPHFSVFKSLTLLSLKCFKLECSEIAELGLLPSLHSLTLENTRLVAMHPEQKRKASSAVQPFDCLHKLRLVGLHFHRCNPYGQLKSLLVAKQLKELTLYEDARSPSSVNSVTLLQGVTLECSELELQTHTKELHLEDTIHAPKLKRLSLYNCNGLFTLQGIETFTQLTALELDLCLQLDGNTEPLKQMVNLERLTLQHVSKLETHSFDFIRVCKKLEILRVIGCELSPDEAYIRALATERGRDLVVYIEREHVFHPDEDDDLY